MAVKRVKIKLDSPGIGRFLRSADVERDIARRAAAIARAAGPGMHSGTVQGRDRVRGQAWTGTDAARRAEANDRALTKAIDAGRA